MVIEVGQNIFIKQNHPSIHTYFNFSLMKLNDIMLTLININKLFYAQP